MMEKKPSPKKINFIVQICLHTFIGLRDKNEIQLKTSDLPHIKNKREIHLTQILDKYSRLGSLKLTPFQKTV